MGDVEEKGMKIFINPLYKHADLKADGGIRRVSEALCKYLPQFGIIPVDKPEEADLINCHGAGLIERQGIPLVASNHGLYWDDYTWPKWAHETNRQVAEVLTRSQAITAPSQWVARALTRGIFRRPTVIYHGVEPDEWKSQPSEGYVLWNKARSDPVSNPDDMQHLAELLPGVQFITTISSTIGNVDSNIKVIGVKPFRDMKPIIQRAGVQLVTARETFGILTLEAMASGVPVVGWRYGGQAEIIREGETGYLAELGNYEELASCVHRALAERERLSANCIDDVRARWLWPDKIAQYATIFKRVYNDWHAPRPKVSVIVTCHDLARFLPDCLRSVQMQTLTDWECIVVDDWSTDETPKIAREFCETDKRFIYQRTPENLKLSGARNFGFVNSRGAYIIPLDADDMLDHEALAVLSSALDKDSSIHIVSGHLDLISEDGSNRRRNADAEGRDAFPPAQFDWLGQIAHLNQIPYSVMMRREAFESVGGYRKRQWRAEDAEMWIRMSSFGFHIRKVTQQSTLIYRLRQNSKTTEEYAQHQKAGEDGPPDGDWTAWFPFRLAGDYKAGAQAIRRGARPPVNLVPWAAQVQPPEKLKFWPVPHHAHPTVSVIIPCGPGHEHYLIDAIESVMAQSYQDFEIIVVNDTGKQWKDDFESPISGAPYVRVLAPKGFDPARGAGIARNAGAAIAKGKTLIFLDSDDMLLPMFLEKTVTEWKRSGRLVYTDHMISRDGKMFENVAKDWECSKWVTNGTEHLVGVLDAMQYGTTCLIPKDAFDKSGGFDEKMPAWEEHSLFIALEAGGLCSVRLPIFGFVYRVQAGHRRVYAELEKDETPDTIAEKEKRKLALRWSLHDKWIDYYQGRKEMPCGCNDSQPTPEPQPQSDSIEAPQNGALMLEYLGDSVSITYAGVEGEALSAQYYFGSILHNPQMSRKWVRSEDARKLLTVADGHGPIFRLVTSEKPLPPEAPKAQSAPDMGIAPRMSDLIHSRDSVRAIADMTLEDLRAALPDSDEARLVHWLADEQAGKQRKGITAALNKALALMVELAR